MIREFHLADWFALGNAACSTGALFSTMSYLETDPVRHIYIAGSLIIATFVFDILDGRIARWRQKSSQQAMRCATVSGAANSISSALHSIRWCCFMLSPAH